MYVSSASKHSPPGSTNYLHTVFTRAPRWETCSRTITPRGSRSLMALVRVYGQSRINFIASSSQNYKPKWPRSRHAIFRNSTFWEFPILNMHILPNPAKQYRSWGPSGMNFPMPSMRLQRLVLSCGLSAKYISCQTHFSHFTRLFEFLEPHLFVCSVNGVATQNTI